VRDLPAFAEDGASPGLVIRHTARRIKSIRPVRQREGMPACAEEGAPPGLGLAPVMHP
jgi:hypothetical protein